MLVKAIMLFLVVMAALALFGRLRFPSIRRNTTCSACGRPQIGKGLCPCGKG